MKKCLVKMEFLLDFFKSYFIKLFIFLFACFISFTGLNSCEKDKELGIEISPENQLISTFLADTFLLNTRTILSDSIKTDELSGSSPLGNYIDPIFGEVNSSIYTQIRIESFDEFEDNTNLVIDSIIMYLVVDGYYGNISEQVFKVERLSESIEKDSNYYSNSEINTYGQDLSLGIEIETNPVSPGYYAGELVSNAILRIPLDQSIFGDPIINESGNSTLSGNDGEGEFLSFFKGIKISSDNQFNGGLYYIDMQNSYSKIKMFYRDTTGSISEHDTLDFDFNINSNCAFFHNVTHNYQGTIIEQAISEPHLGQSQFFIQALGGLNSVFIIPGLDDLKSQNIIINKAEVILPCERYSFDEFNPSNNLFLSRRSSENEYEFLPDFFDGKIGGEFNTSTNSYSFNITRHVNEIMSDKIANDTLKIFPAGGGITANRTVLNGFNSVNKDKAKAIITYTKY